MKEIYYYIIIYIYNNYFIRLLYNILLYYKSGKQIYNNIFRIKKKYISIII